MKKTEKPKSSKIFTAVFITVHSLKDEATLRDSWQRSRLLRDSHCNAWKLEPME